MVEDDPTGKQLATLIAETASTSDLLAIRTWANQLLDIRSSDLSKSKKAKAAIGATLKSSVVWPTMKIIGLKTKQVGWDNRSRTGRLGVAGAAAGIALFGSQSAGIAALGTAIGVPLWVVLGAGASFANVLIEEIGRRATGKETHFTYSVVDTKRVDPAP